MKTKKNLIVLTFLLGWVNLCAQTNDIYRLKALKFFCQNKLDIFQIHNYIPEFDNSEPFFFIGLLGHERYDNGYYELLYYIDSSEFIPDTLLVRDFLEGRELGEKKGIGKIENYIINNQDIQIPQSSSDVLLGLCDCVYIFDDFLLNADTSCTSARENRCIREYTLNVSVVIPYKEKKYVLLRIIAYYKGKPDKFQFCLVEFSNSGTLLRCGVSGVFQY